MTRTLKESINEAIWTEYEVPEAHPLKIEIGPVIIWCIRDKQELRVAWEHFDADRGQKKIPILEDKNWQRWAFKQPKPRIELRPVFPDRPVLIKPENPFKVAEDASVRIYVRIPIWVSINLIGVPGTKLVEIPIVSLSNTWFGTSQEGELCYWISSGARLTTAADPSRPFMAICPLQIVDRSQEDLNVDKICLRVENLSIFQDAGQLWADETKITYQDKTEISQVDISGKAPAEATSAQFVSGPRIKPKKSFGAKTFSTFKDLTNFGLFTKE